MDSSDFSSQCLLLTGPGLVCGHPDSEPGCVDVTVYTFRLLLGSISTDHMFATVLRDSFMRVNRALSKIHLQTSSWVYKHVPHPAQKLVPRDPQWHPLCMMENH